MNLVKANPAGSFAAFTSIISERDLISELLRDKRSENTRRAYSKDLQDFFSVTAGETASPRLVAEFLTLERGQAIALVLKYKASLIERSLAEATINRRLAAIKSLVKFAQKVGQCSWSLEEITGEKVRTYRDTSGVSVETYRRILAQCDRSTEAGTRNYAILRLLWDNALRRGEVVKLNREDFSPELRTLQILGKGRGTQKETVSLTEGTAEAIAAWLKYLPIASPDQPLFISLDPVWYGHRLTGQAIYWIVSETALAAGVTKKFSPHRCRHSAITAALDASGGNVREVQKLSRHSKLETLLVYDDQRSGAQAKVSGLLGDLLD